MSPFGIVIAVSTTSTTSTTIAGVLRPHTVELTGFKLEVAAILR